MSGRQALNLAVLLLLTLAAPAARAQNVFIGRNYRVRIAVKHEVTNLALQGTGTYQVISSGGKPICNLPADQPWFVQITRGRPSDRTYRLVLNELNAHQVAEAIAVAKQAKDEYHMAVKVLRIPARNPEDSRILVTLGEFTSLAAAQEASGKFKKESIHFVYEDRARARGGQVRLMGRDGSILASDERFLRLAPLNLADDSLSVAEMKAASYSPGELSSSRRYRGDIELTINEEGTLTAVNDLWVEYYLYSVVGAEIGTDAPVEALKAQAVAARSESVAKIQLGIVSSSFFDFYDTPICQAYPGKGKETERVRQAVDATRGEILVWKGEPVDAVYSHCCGGVIATSQDLWDGKAQGYSFRAVDRLNKADVPDLSQWATAYQWTSQPVDALCNPNQPGFPNYGKKYHQWRREFSGQEFSRLADRMYNTGAVRDLIVDRRTPSGRVRQLRIIGKDKTVTVKRELELREALGDLYSTYFTFVKEYDKGGLLSRLVVDGAGFGHGVGMCQMGAWMMGTKGYTYRQILAHYFKDVKIRRLYR